MGGGNYVNIKVHYTRKFCIQFLKKAIKNISLGNNQTRKVFFGGRTIYIEMLKFTYKLK